MARKKPAQQASSQNSTGSPSSRGAPPVEEKISIGRHLGYRRSAKEGNGTWFARMRDSQTRKRAMTELGTADDYSDANGADILTFAEAQKKAMEWYTPTDALRGGRRGQAK